MPDRGNPENPRQKPLRRDSGPRVAPPPVEREPGKPPGAFRPKPEKQSTKP